jgi:hypothetical protein
MELDFYTDTQQKIGLGKAGDGAGIASGIFNIVGTLISGKQRQNQDNRALEQKKIDLQIAEKQEASARDMLLSKSYNPQEPNTTKDNTTLYWVIGGIGLAGAVGATLYFVFRKKDE